MNLNVLPVWILDHCGKCVCKWLVVFDVDLGWVGCSPRVYPASRLKSAQMGSSTPVTPKANKLYYKDGWMIENKWERGLGVDGKLVKKLQLNLWMSNMFAFVLPSGSKYIDFMWISELVHWLFNVMFGCSTARNVFSPPLRTKLNFLQCINPTPPHLTPTPPHTTSPPHHPTPTSGLLLLLKWMQD